MNRYEEKQAAKRERYEARAEKAREESRAKLEQARKTSGLIPMGQPILVGHHSEARHRRDLKRINATHDAAHDAHKKAEHYERKAAAVGRGGISSDDPDALAKLGEKLARMESQREQIKAENKQARKEGREPHARYVLTNLGGNIRRVRERIKALEVKAATAPAETVEGEGYTLEECAEDNRLRFVFDGKPSAEVRKLLKGSGFRWAPSVGAWQRRLTDNARYSAGIVRRKLAEMGQA